MRADRGEMHGPPADTRQRLFSGRRAPARRSMQRLLFVLSSCRVFERPLASEDVQPDDGRRSRKRTCTLASKRLTTILSPSAGSPRCAMASIAAARTINPCHSAPFLPKPFRWPGQDRAPETWPLQRASGADLFCVYIATRLNRCPQKEHNQSPVRAQFWPVLWDCAGCPSAERLTRLLFFRRSAHRSGRRRPTGFPSNPAENARRHHDGDPGIA